MAQLMESLLSLHTALSSCASITDIRSMGCTFVFPTLERWKQEDQKFKIVLSNKLNLRPALHETLSKKI